MDARTTTHRSKPTLRVEDEPLLRGQGRFIDDPRAGGSLFAIFVRSPHACARIRSIDASAAKRAAGVVAVLTAPDMVAAGVVDVTRHPPMIGRGGAKLVMPRRPPLADGRVMHIGQAVAAVIAATPAQAADAVELVQVDYEEMTPVIDARAAIAPGAAQLWPEAPGNLAIDWPGPVADDGSNAREVEQILRAAPHVARITVVNQRLIVASMEPRGGTASYDATSNGYVLRVCSQSASVIRDNLAPIMGVARERLRVITEDVGGAFGLKTSVYPEYPVLLVAAKLTGEPVHWMSTRSEAFLSDNQARDSVSEAELALDQKGTFLALRVRHLANVGAFVATAGVHLNTNNFARCLTGMYAIPRVDVGARCVFTNTLPIGPYRGAGRPELNYLLERVVDEAARVTGIDRVKLRRRNLIPPSAMPYRTPVGTTYDSGNFPAVVDKAITLADYSGFIVRRRASEKRGRLRGIGISCFLEHAGALPSEGAALLFPGDHTLLVALGVGNTGQGHTTVYARIAAERLGIAPEHVRVRQGDTTFDVASSASVGSRSTMAVGHSIVCAFETVIDKRRQAAALLLEVGADDITYRDGQFVVAGTDRQIPLFDLAARAAGLAKQGEIAADLDTKVTTETPQTFPNGCHIAEVEVDPDTGSVAVVRYTAVDDCGTVIDHTLVEGQLYGGVAQGLGQALFEHAVYDPGSGQLVTGSFMDYALPRADIVPVIADAEVSVPATTNPLGVKGVGEAGTTGSLAAIMNALADAVPGGAHLDMPATAEKVWVACRA